MQMVFQDPYSSLDPRMKIHDIIAEPLRINHCYSRARVEALLDLVGLNASVASRAPADFSGGQRQRISIARALALNPNLLILDEPLSALDLSVQAQVLNVLTRLQKELGLTYVFVAHDLSAVRHMSDRVAVMYFGRLVEIGGRDQVFDQAAHPYTKALIAATPDPDPSNRGRRGHIMSVTTADDAGRGCNFLHRCPRARKQCALEAPPLSVVSVGHQAACWFPDQARGA
jgi:oligopeptide/dipeptide ABC transporter ATP-binding protein